MGFPSRGEPEFGGKALNALSRAVEVPYPGIDDGIHPPVTPEIRRRVEEFIGCTLEQSYSEFTVELKNTVHRMMDTDDHSTAARHRGGGMGRRRRARRVA